MTGVPPRYPVRRDADGDFTTAEILRATGRAARPPWGRAPAVARAALHARIWQLSGSVGPVAAVVAAAGMPAERGSTMVPDEADGPLLRAFETAPLWQVPVARSTAGLDPATSRAWLALAAHWAATATAAGDLRFLNIACKLLGAVWSSSRLASPGQADPQDLAAAAAAVEDASAVATQRLAARLIISDGQPATPRLTALLLPSKARGAAVTVLASSGSATARRLTAEAPAAGVTVGLLCWYSPRQDGPPVESGYAEAWYPPQPEAASRDWQVPAYVRQASARTWDEVSAILRSEGAGVVILAGMPVVPGHVLEAARLGVVNAHNGSLPGYRGMDAVGWALLGNDPVVCTLHLARAAVDRGEIIASVPVTHAPAGTLRTRVKDAQVRLLLGAAAYTTAHGRLPDATAQAPGAGRHYYRLHPHLKRLLEGSPYAETAITK